MILSNRTFSDVYTFLYDRVVQSQQLCPIAGSTYQRPCVDCDMRVAGASFLRVSGFTFLCSNLQLAVIVIAAFKYNRSQRTKTLLVVISHAY